MTMNNIITNDDTEENSNGEIDNDKQEHHTTAATGKQVKKLFMPCRKERSNNLQKIEPLLFNLNVQCLS